MVENLFTSVTTHWLYLNLPIPHQYKYLIDFWLDFGGVYSPTFLFSFKAQSSILIPTITNFILDGLEKSLRRLASLYSSGFTFFEIWFIRYGCDVVILAKETES
jgi:hypothetical protein